MSVFGVKDLWLNSLGDGSEEFDVNSMCWIETQGLVVTGSLRGVLRIFRLEHRGFMPEDLILERELEPILQISAGEFMRASEEQVLAVLHKNKLSVYRVNQSESISNLNLCFQHDFRFNVFNFAFGRISSSSTMNICVQSSSGDLLFYENETWQFSISFPLHIVPGPLTFSSFNQSLVVCSANMEVELYSYSKLLSTSANPQAKYEPEFLANIGEHALSVEVVDSKELICVLGEHSIFCLSKRLEFVMIKRVDYPPSCFAAYLNENRQLMLVVGSFTGHLLVYRDQFLVWTAKCEDSPIVMKRIQLRLPGMLLMLNETGRLRVSYLGTSPLPHSILPSQPGKSIESMENELYKFQALLADSGSSREQIQPLSVSIQVEPVPRIEPHFIEGFVSENSLITTYATIYINSAASISGLTIQVCTARGIEASENPLSLESLPSRGSHSFTVGFNTKVNHFVASLEGRLTFAYKQDKSCRVGEVSFRLPFAQIATTDKLREYKHMIVFGIQGSPPPLSRLFPDFASSGPTVQFLFYNGEQASILPSKTGNKVQLAATDFSVLGVLADELNNRLLQSSCQLTYSDIPPISFLLSAIDIHYNCRKAQAEGEIMLAKQMEQFIAVEKRLLTRFKDKSPAPVNNLDYLLSKTLRQLEDLATQIEQLKQAAAIEGEKLSGILRLTTLTARSLFNLTDADVAVLNSYLPVEVNDDEVGWEETALSGVIELLRTKLAKNERERNVSRGSLEFPSSTEQLKKNIGIVFERLSKGQKLT
mmetsp:Transcript_16821/g.30065  ORF Transcript_16821/g.30065 Transcript_16821/m.30065 type:complete len:765 (+) Transcript_16821:2861-5155(+)